MINLNSELIPGTTHTHPEFRFPGPFSDLHDIAVIVLDTPVAIEPAQLPEEGLLDHLKATDALDDQVFTAVGYGAVRETRKKAPGRFCSTRIASSVASRCRALCHCRTHR